MERVKNTDIIVGEPILWDVYDDKGELLLRKGYVIESATQLKTLVDRGLFHIETLSDSGPAEQVKHTISPFEILVGVQKYLSCLFNGLNTELTNNFHIKTLDLCKTIQEACEKDTDASLSVIFLKKSYPYTIRHPVHIAIVCEIISRHLKWKKEDRLSLLAAALTANIAMINLQEKLFSQKEPLSAEQRQHIYEHPQRGVEILRKAGVTNNLWLDAVFYHHEAIDGSGYPSGLKASAIPIRSRILAVGDHYCAGVSNREYRTALSPTEAMREIYVNSGKRVESEIVNMCVRLIGIYPPGSFVRLVNDEIAVVTQRGSKAHTPVVHSIVRANGTLFLTPERRDCTHEEFAVKELIISDNDKLDINPHQLWGYSDMLVGK
jgi:HD-GYP domain-containing protein (c-di-GMP phosphodiesterase class II)